MPIVFSHTPRLRLRIATYFGVIDDVTLLRAYRAAAADYDLSLDNIVDLSGVTSVLLTEKALDEVAHLFHHIQISPVPTRLGVVACDDRTADVARLAERIHAGAQTHICGTLADAHSWLRVVHPGT